MLFPADQWDGLRDGTIAVAYRSWKRPTVKEGGTLITPGGLLAIDRVTEIDIASITADDAARAGTTLDDLRSMLDRGDDRRTFRIEFHRLGDDPRIARRADDHLDDEALADLDRRLARLDAASRTGPWTLAVLRVVQRMPATVSTELAAELDVDRAPFKLNVRKLKGLGLTESLDVGYRLSPRGERYLDLRPDGPPPRQDGR